MDLSKFLKKLERISGPVHLLMATGSSYDTRQSLNLIVSSEKLDPMPVASAIKQITNYLRAHVAPEDLLTFSRITVLNANDPFVRAITSAFAVAEGPMNLPSCSVDGIQIDNAIIYKSTR